MNASCRLANVVDRSKDKQRDEPGRVHSDGVV